MNEVWTSWVTFTDNCAQDTDDASGGRGSSNGGAWDTDDSCGGWGGSGDEGGEQTNNCVTCDDWLKVYLTVELVTTIS